MLQPESNRRKMKQVRPTWSARFGLSLCPKPGPMQTATALIFKYYDTLNDNFCNN